MTAPLPDERRVHRRSTRGSRRRAIPDALLLSGALVAGSATAVLVAAAPAQAAPRGQGRVASAWQSTINHRIHVTGFAYDPASKHSSVRVSVYANGRWLRSVSANDASARYDRRHHLHGRHALSATMSGPWRAKQLRLVVHPAGHGAGSTVDRARVARRTPTSEHIVSVARRYVGARYSYGADGPRAFDCSGYAKFVYQRAHIAALPHNSQAQRHAKHMHRISRSAARPGDLVFYLSGGSAYHVSIYAGQGSQYSATNPRRGVEHSHISSSNVIFESDWH